MTHLRAALSILACRALEAHYRRNLARVVPQPEPMRVIRNDQRVRLVRVDLAYDRRWDTGYARDYDFPAWEHELATTP